MPIEIVARLQDVDAAAWDRLNRHDYPFLRHAFLVAAEETACVSPATGWQPCHLLMRDDEGQLLAAMPLYEKMHSFGEFVFDWAWARAYSQAGLDYYPKLVSAVPFTPAGSPRLLCQADLADTAPRALLDRAIALAKERGASSLHVQFPHVDELPVLQQAGLKLRKDCQFHWRNRNYQSFDEFLAQFSSRKRKKVRRDRRAVSEQGIHFQRLHGNEMSAELWATVYELISRTFLNRGGMPYYNLDFFMRVAASLPANIMVILAQRQEQPIAAAVFFVSTDTLYGRYWGSDGQHDALHFETCYYQGIDYCIEHGLQSFEPGTQGEHKVSRGFLPTNTWSAHWLAHDEFFAAVGQYLKQEQAHVDNYIDDVEAHSPYRRSPDQEAP